MPRRPDDLQRKRQRHRRKRVAIQLLISLCVGAAVYVVYFSSYLAVTNIQVLQCSMCDPGKVVAAANIQMGTPLARVDSGAVAKNVLRVREIQGVELRRAWPHTIVLAVTERVPLALTDNSVKSRYIDATGVIFGLASKKDSHLLVIRAQTRAERVVAARVAAALPAWLKPELIRITAQSQDTVTFELNKNRTVLFGDDSRITRKFRVLQALLDIKASKYDVSAPDMPVTIR